MVDLIYYIGLATVLYHSWKTLQFAYIYLYRPTAPLARYKRDTDSWAFITGSSDGIGFGLAQTLRKEGWNLILLSHQADKLNSAKTALETEFPNVKADIKVLVYDAMTDSGPSLEKSLSSIITLPITVLINNIGGIPISPPSFRSLSQYTTQEIDNVIQLNNRFIARLTSLMLPTLARNGPSLIANMSSGAQVGIPWLVMYSATKGFISSFTLALCRELRADTLPISCINLIPGDVRSFQHQAPLAWNVPSSRAFGEAVVRGMSNAVDRGYLEWSPFWVHGVMLEILEWVPEWVRQAALRDEIRKKRRMFDKVE
jgi:17beta-estradiol 17-dehydrogenase / very-long-chain 3-oxoacyl-CoA reductase